MLYNILGWIGFALLSIGLWYIGKKKRWAFIFTGIGEVFIFIYSINIGAWSIAAIGLLFMGLAARNWLLWAKPEVVCQEKDGRSFIWTYTQKKLDLVDPQPDQICIEDIAHHLARLCRFTGATNEFYSVAQHCVEGSRISPRHRALDFLMHDSEEYAFNDLNRPAKYLSGMEAYRERPLHLRNVIARKFGFDASKDGFIDMMDNRLYTTEVRDLCGRVSTMCGDYPPLSTTIVPMGPAEAEAAFLKEFYELTLPEEK